MYTLYYKKIEAKSGVYRYSMEKEMRLIEARGVSFRDIINAIDDGAVVDVVDNYNQKKYPGQKMFIIKLDEYFYMVPFMVNQSENILLKTIIPSRKAKKQYLSRSKIYEVEKKV